MDNTESKAIIFVEMPSDISVIICCYNSAKVIENTLAHLKKQEFGEVQWEIILVDNNSHDDTAARAAKCWEGAGDQVPLRIVSEPNPGLSNARIRGVNTARYPVISFIDDDNLVPVNWIAYQSRIFENEEIGILGCRCAGKFDNPPPVWYESNKYAFATGDLYTEDFLDVTADGAVFGAGMTLRKSVFEQLFAKNWHPVLSGRIGSKQAGGEDSELCQAARLLGYRIFYTNQISLDHYIMDERLTWERLISMTRGFGAADALILPYSLTYEKLAKGNSLNFLLRKHWWFNYLAKKIMIWVRDPLPFLNREPHAQGVIVRARMEAFCEAIVRDRELFKECFTLAVKLSAKQDNI